MLGAVRIAGCENIQVNATPPKDISRNNTQPRQVLKNWILEMGVLSRDAKSQLPISGLTGTWPCIVGNCLRMVPSVR